MDTKFALLYLILVLVSCSLQSDDASSTLSGSDILSVSSNRTLVSSGEVFEFGFFSLVPNSNVWYMGIWYKKVPVRTYVWVANRERPVNTLNAILQLVDADLILRGQSDNPSFFWTTRESSPRESPVVAELLDTGNLVLRYSKNKDPQYYLWESFNNPTDTLLPQMELRSDPELHNNKLLSSWKSLDNPAGGEYKFIVEAQGSPELLLKDTDRERRMFRIGPWNGYKFPGIPPIFNLTSNREEVSVSFTPTYSYSYTRLRLTYSGRVILFTWNQNAVKWDSPWVSPENECEVYDWCGANSVCDTNLPSVCSCIPGVEPKYPNNTFDCPRNNPLRCGGDQFSLLGNMSIPDAFEHNRQIRHEYVKEINECKRICVADCNCTAFAVIGSSRCVILRDALHDLRRYNNSDDGGDLYIKINGKDASNGVIMPWIVAGAILGVIVFSLLGIWLWKSKHKRPSTEIPAVPRELELSADEMIDNRQLPPMDFGAIVEATQNFSTEIGRGGFGNVYKGRLLTGQEIAVKNLKKNSRQSTDQFYTEVRLIASLHINVVSLLGWSIHKNDKLLIYEYMENGSLEHYIFDEAKSCELKWEKRFDIIIGVARGLAYLQNDSRVRIIHRDLKPANVLLDRDMIPKISDFGFARTSERSENEAITVLIPGTRGYMSPEYAGDGIYSAKSDIFSFGITILEVITGKRNKSYSYSGSGTGFISNVWTKWTEGNFRDIIDQKMIEDSSPFNQILRCIEIALLCVQQNAADRPTMNVVVASLENESLEIPRPKPPCTSTEISHIPSSSNTNGEGSTLTNTINQLYTSDLEVIAR